MQEAWQRLKQGELVGMPTDTVYGLAADATQDQAVAKIYAAKGRPSFNPLIIHVRDVEQGLQYGHWNPDALLLAEYFWQRGAPLTIVVPYRLGSGISSLALAGQDTIALRQPNHPIALALLKGYPHPLAAPSANRSNQLSPTTKAHVQGYFPDLHVLDGGNCTVGLESTIVACVEDQVAVLRPGLVTREDIEARLGKPCVPLAIMAPGMLKKHYAPQHPLRLGVAPEDVREDELYIGFGGIAGDVSLSPSGDLVEAAARLFAVLHDMDAWCREQGKRGIAIAPIPETGIGVALWDRLRRAAS